MPLLPHIPELSEEAAEAIRAAFRTILRRIHRWALSTIIIILALAAPACLFVWLNKDFLLSYQTNALDVKHLAEAHEHCQHELNEVKARVAASEMEIQRLKDRQARN